MILKMHQLKQNLKLFKMATFRATVKAKIANRKVVAKRSKSLIIKILLCRLVIVMFSATHTVVNNLNYFVHFLLLIVNDVTSDANFVVC